MPETADLSLVIANAPENVAVVRQALAGLAEAVALDHGVLEGVKTAVSEACNNVVVHAYGDRPGPLEVLVGHDEHEVEVRVTDCGAGMREGDPDPDVALAGMGIDLMKALADRVQFANRPGGGTAVTLAFRSPLPLTLTGGSATGQGAVGSATAEPDAGAPVDTRVVVGAGRVAAPVLSRVTGMLAARAGLSLERLADTQLITDALAAHAPSWVIGEGLELGVVPGGVGVILRLGPLRPGGADELVRDSAVGGLPPLIEQLADDVSVEEDAGAERLRLLVAQRG